MGDKMKKRIVGFIRKRDSLKLKYVRFQIKIGLKYVRFQIWPATLRSQISKKVDTEDRHAESWDLS